MQRVIPLLLCVSGSTFIGLMYADSLKRRAERLKSMRDGVRQLAGGVQHTNRPLYAIAGEIAQRGGDAFWASFSEGVREGGGAEAAWNHALERACQRGGSLYGLNARDRTILTAFSATLGRTDRRTQDENARAALDALDAQILAADAVYMQKGRIYRTLGLFFGLGLAILLW